MVNGYLKKFKGCNRLSEFYKKAHKNSIFRATLPLLISFENNEINVLSNESSDIIELLNSIKKNLYLNQEYQKL